MKKDALITENKKIMAVYETQKVTILIITANVKKQFNFEIETLEYLPAYFFPFPIIVG